MPEDAMPGEALLSNGVQAEHRLLKQQQHAVAAASENGASNKKLLQEMAEKLEKSEAGRKKLRQAISMLKEKVEANEKVLQVNEILRQECEKERLRADAERNRAEEEKKLRENLEKEGLSSKDQLVRVLQRLDAVERNCKADHTEIERMRKEMKQAVSGLGGAVKAIEAAHSSFESLEKDLLGKVSNAVCASTKSTSLAETAVADAKGAQGTAAAAQKLSDSLVSRVEALQKQGAILDQRVTLLQQEILKRQSEPSDNELKSNRNLPSNGISLAADKPGRGMVLSKNQQQACTRLTSLRTANKDCSPDSAAFRPKPIQGEGISTVVLGAKPADKDSLGICGAQSPKMKSGAKEAEINGMESFPDGQSNKKTSRDMSTAPAGGKAVLEKSVPDSSRDNIVRQALEAAKEKRKLQRTASSNNVVGKSSSSLSSTPVTLSSNGAHPAKDVLVEEFRGRLQVDSSSGAVLAMVENEKNKCISYGREDNVEDFPERRPCTKKKLPRAPDGNRVESKLVSANLLVLEKKQLSETPISATKTDRNGHKREKLPVALLTEITKLFQKEKKSREKVEQKLSALQKVLQNSADDEFVQQRLVDAPVEKSRKRKRRESLTERSDKRARARGVEKTPQVKLNEDHPVLSHGHRVGGIVACGAIEVGASKRKINTTGTAENSIGPPQPLADESRYLDSRGFRNDISNAGWKRVENSTDLDGPQFADVDAPSLVPGSLAAATTVIEPCQGMDIDITNFSAGDLNGGWDSDSEISEDEMGEEWWAEKRVLLSPSLPEVKPPSLPLEGPDSNAPLAWPAASNMNPEDISLFLDVLPPIDQEIISDEDRATFPTIARSELETEELLVESDVTADGQRCKEFERGLAKDTFNDLHKCRELSPSSTLVQSLEIESKLPDNLVGCAEDEEKEGRITGSSFRDNALSLGSRPEPSFCPQDVSVVAVGKSEGVDDGLAVDSGSRGGDVHSKGALKEEKGDAAQSIAMEHFENSYPYSVELVMGDLAQERWVSSSWSTKRQESLGSATDTSNTIMKAFGRTRELLRRALNHSNDNASGSSPAVAPEIASFIGSSTLSNSALMCIFTSSLVDSLALWDNEKTSSCLRSDCKSLQLLVDIVKQVLADEVVHNILCPDQAFLLFAVQLQKFLIRGTLQPVGQGVPGEAHDEGCAMEQCFHFATSSSRLEGLKALVSGSKLLAAFCKSFGNLDFLRNTVYRVLRFCDMDNECLLAIISFLVRVGQASLFSKDKDDVVGQAVQVVISELIHDAEVERPVEAFSAKREENECQMEMQHGSSKGGAEGEGSAVSTLLLQNLRALGEVIETEECLSFEGFLPRLVELFYGVITATPSAYLIGNRHLFQRSLRMITCNEIKPSCPIHADGLVKSEQSLRTCHVTDVILTGCDEPAVQSEKNHDDGSPVEYYCWRDVTVKRSRQPVSESERDASLIEEWEQKFYDITNAVELVASHLGWEWAYNDFIVEHLWKLVSPGAPSMSVACVAHMFGLLGRLGREVDHTELPGVDELRKSLLVVLSLDQRSPSLSGGPTHNFPFRAQVAAAQALLVLSSSNKKDEAIPIEDAERVFWKSSELHAKSVKSLWNWVQARKPEIQEILPSSLRYALLSIDKNNFVPIF
ncbi:unnamed protein product [Calypogeia fissa]